MEEEIKTPVGTVFTLTLPLDRDGKKATFFLKDMDEALYFAMRELLDARKTYDAYRLIIKSLSLPGSDDVSLLKNNYVAMNSASVALIEIITPLNGELKKNY